MNLNKTTTNMPKSLFFKSALIFLFFLSLFLSAHLLNNNQFTSRDDPYYHAKHSALIAESGNLNLVKPWLEFHFFNYAPADPWWGFHSAMALFIKWFGLFLGVKIFVSLLAALVFAVFYLVLNNLGIKYPSAWVTFLFFSSTVFSYRLFLERPHLLSMIVLPLALLFLIKGKNFWLFILSLIYALCYDLAPLIILQTLIYLAVGSYINKRINLKPLIASAGGILIGMLAHPASLNYVYIIFMQLWQAFFLKFTGTNLGIGGESQIMDFFKFMQANFLVMTVYIFAAALFLALRKFYKKSVIHNFLFVYSSLWFLVTLLVPRGVEYWLPVVFLLAGVIFSDFTAREEFEQAKNWLAARLNFKIAGFFLISVLIVAIFNNLSNVFFDLYYSKTGETGESYRQANLWLKANSEQGSIVFYDNWGMWPMMFFYNDYNHYIAGIDPTFLYEYDKQTYWLWRNISGQGLYCDQPRPCLNLSPRQQLKFAPLAIKTVFRAKYAVASNYKDNNLIKTLNSLKSEAKLVFKNQDLLIYEMR